MAPRTSEHNKYWSVAKCQCLPAVLFTTLTVRGLPTPFVCQCIRTVPAENSALEKGMWIPTVCRNDVGPWKYLWVNSRPNHKVPTNLAEKRQVLVILPFKTDSLGVIKPCIQRPSIQLLVAKTLLVFHLWLFLFFFFFFSVQPDFFFLASFLQGWEYTSVWELMPWFTAATPWNTNSRARLPVNPSQQPCLAPLRSWQCHFRLWAYGQGLSS